MDQANQDNELQRAIDDITKNAGGEQGDVAADLEQQIQDQMGTPPAPEMPAMNVPAGTMPGEMPMPEGMTSDASSVEAPVEAASGMAMPMGDNNTESPAEPAAEVTVDETVAAPVAENSPVVETETATVELNDMGGNDINTVKEAMLRDLFPIMDKVDMGAEEKFELYKTMLDDTNDKSLIAGAYEVVKGIADEAARAEALLFLIKKADA